MVDLSSSLCKRLPEGKFKIQKADLTMKNPDLTKCHQEPWSFIVDLCWFKLRSAWRCQGGSFEKKNGEYKKSMACRSVCEMRLRNERLSLRGASTNEHVFEMPMKSHQRASAWMTESMNQWKNVTNDRKKKKDIKKETSWLVVCLFFFNILGISSSHLTKSYFSEG